MNAKRDVRQLIWGLQVAGIVKAAIELKLFDLLAGSPGLTAEGVAEHLRISERGARILLDALSAVEWICREGEGYCLAPESEPYLVRTSPRYVGDLVQLFSTPVMWQGYERFAEAARTGGTILGAHAESPEFALWDSFAELTERLAARGGRALARLLAERVRASELRVLDVACGTGLYGFNVARQFPGASITSLDWPRVLERSRRYAEGMAVSDRVSYLPGDMFTVDLGGPYDLVIASHVFHHFDDTLTAQLLRRVAAATRPGGTLAIHDFVITGAHPSQDPEPYLFATTMLISTRHGETYSSERFSRLLADAGYGAPDERSIPNMPTRFLFAERLAP